MRTQLLHLENSLRAAGREADADSVAAVRDLSNEVGEWLACLRCSMAFPTSAAHSAHYSKEHR